MDKIKSWWSEDGKWFCILANDGMNQTTVSLTRAEAKALAVQIYDPARPSNDDACDCGAMVTNSDNHWLFDSKSAAEKVLERLTQPVRGRCYVFGPITERE